MSTLGQFVQSGDWKGEKHVPVIHLPEKINAGEPVTIKVSIGDAIKHPNTLEHHIAWFKLMFVPEGGKFPVELGNYEFRSHGEFDTLAEPEVSATVSFKSAGTLLAVSYCNIHGLWESSAEIKIG